MASYCGSRGSSRETSGGRGFFAIAIPVERLNTTTAVARNPPSGSGRRLAAPRQSPPKRRRRGIHQASFVAKPFGAIGREQKRAVEVDEARPLREQDRRRHRQRRRNHAADHDQEAAAFGFGGKRPRFGHPERLFDI